MIPIPIAGPAVEPVTVAEMRAYLRLDDEAEADLIAALITAARLQVEAATRCTLIAQTWRIVLDAWPPGRVVRLPLWPVVEIEAVRVSPCRMAPCCLSHAPRKRTPRKRTCPA